MRHGLRSARCTSAAGPWQNQAVASVNWPEVRKRVKALTSHAHAGPDFQARLGHGYRLHPPLTASELAEVHHQLGVELPIEYQDFLLYVGAGGAGPYYGVFPLSKIDGRWRWEDDGADLTDLGHLAEAFPLRTSSWRTVESLEADRPEPMVFVRADAYHDAETSFHQRYEALVWNPRLTYGAICIAHEGCGLRRWLVVSGPERGNIWIDHRIDGGALTPAWLPARKHSGGLGSARVTFGLWYLDWLRNAELSLGIVEKV